MNPENRAALLFVCALAASLLVSGCGEKGCTDSLALNYNKFARSDDGSCLYCERQRQQTGQISRTLYDFNFNSPYYNTAVANFSFTQFSDKHNFSSCGTDDCEIYFTIENLVDKRITFTYFMQGSGSNLFFETTNKAANVPAYQTSPTDSVSTSIPFSQNLCGNLGFVDIILQSEISYN